jgi:hypothetical protein
VPLSAGCATATVQRRSNLIQNGERLWSLFLRENQQSKIFHHGSHWPFVFLW